MYGFENHECDLGQLKVCSTFSLLNASCFADVLSSYVQLRRVQHLFQCGIGQGKSAYEISDVLNAIVI